jgi:hypothetical protein
MENLRLVIPTAQLQMSEMWWESELPVCMYEWMNVVYYFKNLCRTDRLCGLVVRVLGYRSGGPGSIPGTNRKTKTAVGLERGPLSLVSTTEELLDRKVAAPV